MTDLDAIITGLERAYGIPKPGRRRDPLESLILTILSQNTNDVNRDRAYTRLRRRFPTWESVLEADSRTVANAIRVGGIANVKSRHIRQVLREVRNRSGTFDLRFLRNHPTDEVERILTSFKGVGLKTARIVILFALGRPVFPVDTHIHRLTKRMGLVPARASRAKTHEIMGALVPPDKMYSFHLNLIAHGRRICTARKAHCDRCPVNVWCAKVL